MESAGPGPEAQPHERLPRKARVRRGVEIVQLLRRGRRDRTPHLDVFSAPRAEGGPRFGTITPKHRNSVVERNLVRRRLKEIGRTEVLPRLRTAGGRHDVLVRARPSAYAASFSTLKAELVRFTEGLCSDASSSD